LCALIAGIAALVQFSHVGVEFGAPHGAKPGAYIAVPGSWHSRWVLVKDPPPGTPRYVRQRYRTIHYVSATPLP
jgi:hypothetical protein